MNRKRMIIGVIVVLLLVIAGFFIYDSFTKEENFTKTNLLKLNLPLGGELSTTVKIVNYDKEPHDFNVYLNNFQKLVFLEETQFSLEREESKDLTVSFIDNIGEVEIYLGKLIIETDVSKEEVLIILGVEDPNHAFAIIKNSIPKYDNVYPGGKLGIEIKVYDLVGANVETISANYLIKNFENEILMSSTGNLVIGGSKTELFDISSDWEKGDYVFITSIDYKGIKSLSSYLFTVSKEKTIFGNIQLFLIIIVVFFAIILTLILYFIKTRDDLLIQLKRQQSAELKRNLSYIKISKRAVEKSKEHPKRKKKKLLELDKAKKRIIKKIKGKQKEQRRKLKELKKRKKKPQAKSQLDRWKAEGYKMFDTESEVKKITKKGIKQHMKDWKEKGYATGFLTDKK